MYQVFEKGVIDKGLFSRYQQNKRDPRLSTINEIMLKLADV